jgi:multiple sugar transport system substrate-binding protein
MTLVNLKKPHRRDFLKTVGAGLTVPVAASLPGRARAADPITLNVWQWIPDFDVQVDLFNKANPNIKLVQLNVGNSAQQSVKLRNVLTAKTGGPDIVMFTYAMVNGFSRLGAMADLTPYGAADLKSKYTNYAWSELSKNGKIYGLPLDSGPLVQVYRQDLIEKFGVKVPQNWDEFADVAAKVHAKSPTTFMTDCLFSRGEWTMAQLWQQGWRGFETNGDTVSIEVNGKLAKDFARYWQALLDDKLVEAQPGFTTDFFSALDDDRYVEIIAGNWFPNYFRPQAKKTAGKWRVAPAPQVAGKATQTAWGGAAFGVWPQTKYPKEAFEAMRWFLTERAPTELYVNKQFLTPTLNTLLDDKVMLDTPFEFCGGQKVNEVVFDAAKKIMPPIAWAPFHDYVIEVMNDELSQAGAGKRKLAEGFDRIQDKLVIYAKDQGFTVKT